jgi:hypothetical protein
VLDVLHGCSSGLSARRVNCATWMRVETGSTHSSKPLAFS